VTDVTAPDRSPRTPRTSVSFRVSTGRTPRQSEPDVSGFQTSRRPELEELFEAYATFGNTQLGDALGPVLMDNANFAKLIRECGLLSSSLTSGDVDIVFSKVKSRGSRRINFEEFCTALGLIGERLLPDRDTSSAFHEVVGHVLTSDGPASRATVRSLMIFPCVSHCGLVSNKLGAPGGGSIGYFQQTHR
jgi:Ca2+-binding EF-hand superfamily protein